jgi:hydroxyacylglutathione hydrolase
MLLRSVECNPAGEERRVLIDRLVLTSAESNCYLVSCERTRHALVVDPGDDADRILARAGELGMYPRLVVITHAHWDHVNAAGVVAERSGCPIAMHPADADLLTLVPEVTLERTGALGPPLPTIDRPLSHGDILEVGDVRLSVLHTPGHTPGSVCLRGDGILFSGDTLMAGWIGRTDRPGGSQLAIRSSVWDQLLSLPDDTLVYAGHLEPTSIGVERRENPYLTGQLPLR